jgi:hypothetical protein
LATAGRRIAVARNCSHPYLELLLSVHDVGMDEQFHVLCLVIVRRLFGRVVEIQWIGKNSPAA